MIIKRRQEEMSECFWAETNDEETQEWRYGLTSEESKLVDEWDDDYERGVYKLCKAILEAQERNNLAKAG